MPNFLAKPEKYLHKIVDVQQILANITLIFMMAIITIDVFGRNFLNNPLKGTYELTELSSALLVFFALAITHKLDDHITIDFFTDRLPKKIKSFLFGVIELVITIVLFLMANHLFENGLRMMERNSTTTDLSIPLYPVLFIIAFTVIIFMLTALFKAIAYFRLAVKPE